MGIVRAVMRAQARMPGGSRKGPQPAESPYNAIRRGEKPSKGTVKPPRP